MHKIVLTILCIIYLYVYVDVLKYVVRIIYTDILAQCDQYGIVKTKGIYIGRVEFGKTTRRPGHEKPAICGYTFQPYVSVGNRRSTSLGIQRQKNSVEENTKTDCERLHEQSLREAIKLTAENCRRDMRVMLVNHNEQAKVLQSILDDLYHHDPVICTNRKDNVDQVKTGNVEFVELDFQKNGFQKTDLFDLLVINNEFVQTKRSLDDYLSHLNSVVAYGGFVLAHWYFATGDPCETDDDINKVDDLSDDLYSAFKRAKYKLVFQKESFTSECCMVWRKPQRNQTRTILPVTLKDFSWIKRLQMEMKNPLHSPEDHTIWLVSDEMTNGLLGFMKCLHQEPGGHRVRLAFYSAYYLKQSTKRIPKIYLDFHENNSNKIYSKAFKFGTGLHMMWNLL